MTTYVDKATCPEGHRFSIRRKISTAGAKVSTMCPACGRAYAMRAGPTTETPTLRERDIEAQLVKRVQQLGGEVRKVQWLGRVGAPDRLVMLPWERCVLGDNGVTTIVWVEVKAPGKAAKFPGNAHERAQHREHERMRRVGQRVEVVDSFERIEEILK